MPRRLVSLALPPAEYGEDSLCRPVHRLMLLALLVCSLPIGCASKSPRLDRALPVGHQASPWVLDGIIWSGRIEDAAESLGEEAAAWSDPMPQRIWLAVYRHDTKPEVRLVLRALSYDSRETAARVYDVHRPARAEDFRAGEAGHWTDAGVMFRAGRVVFEVFAAGPAELVAPEQAAYLATIVTRGLSPQVVDNPE